MWLALFSALGAWGCLRIPKPPRPRLAAGCVGVAFVAGFLALRDQNREVVPPEEQARFHAMGFGIARLVKDAHPGGGGILVLQHPRPEMRTYNRLQVDGLNDVLQGMGFTLHVVDEATLAAKFGKEPATFALMEGDFTPSVYQSIVASQPDSVAVVSVIGAPEPSSARLGRTLPPLYAFGNPPMASQVNVRLLVGHRIEPKGSAPVVSGQSPEEYFNAWFEIKRL